MFTNIFNTIYSLRVPIRTLFLQINSIYTAEIGGLDIVSTAIFGY